RNETTIGHRGESRRLRGTARRGTRASIEVFGSELVDARTLRYRASRCRSLTDSGRSDGVRRAELPEQYRASGGRLVDRAQETRWRMAMSRACTLLSRRGRGLVLGLVL